MIYYLFRDLFHNQRLLLRIAAAAITSFAIVMLTAPRMIRFLFRKKVGDRPEFDRSDLNELMRHKSNTPTMGGVVMAIAILVSVLLFADLGNMYISMALVALVWLAALGGWDDWLKLRRSAGATGRDGLKSWEKILFQIGLAVLLAIFIHKYGGQAGYSDARGRYLNPAHSFYFPFVSDPVSLSLPAYVIITALTMVGACNAVNLTDGMDGLATGSVITVTGVLLVLSWLVGVTDWAHQSFNLPSVAGAAEMTILCAAMLGACLGFLWFNAHPAQVFMGDTGSLPLGGLIGYIAVVTRQEMLLLLAGGVLVMEASSVMLQVGYFKFTRRRTGTGRRLFRCAPLHHHFHLGGWAETKVVARFWILGLLFAALALATLKLR